MDLLEHPLEAIAFRLYSLPIPEAASAATGAAAWTCLAAGLWRLRSSTPAGAVAVSTKPLELNPSRAAEVSSPEPPSRPSSQRSPPEPAAASMTTTSPKERYTAYFRDAGCVRCCDVGSDEDGNNEEEDDDADEEHEDGDRDVFVSDGAGPFRVGGGEVAASASQPDGGAQRRQRGAAVGSGRRRRLDADGEPAAEGPSRRRRRLGLLNIQSPDEQ